MKTYSNLNFCRDIALVVAGICLATAITTIANVYFPTEPAVYDYFCEPLGSGRSTFGTGISISKIQSPVFCNVRCYCHPFDGTLRVSLLYRPY
jgi:hypothetical protein